MGALFASALVLIEVVVTSGHGIGATVASIRGVMEAVASALILSPWEGRGGAAYDVI
jgi:hypothetical protein